MRIFAGIILGIVAAVAAIWLTDVITQQFYPIPLEPEAAPGAPGEVAWVPTTIPTGALLFVALAWFIGAFVGGSVAAAISRRRWTAWMLAALVLIAATVLTAWLPAPGWAKMGAVVAPMLGGLLATFVASFFAERDPAVQPRTAHAEH